MLSTYNGHRFLREQLDSLYAQENVEIHILVRDDGSEDDTVNILKGYQQKYGKMTILAEENVGCSRSFFTLVRYATEHSEIHSDYYAFCDQDDQWLLEKLKRATDKLDNSNAENKLYFCTSNIVDVNLNVLSITSVPKVFDYTTSVFCNPALGCTMVFNRKLLEICNKAPEVLLGLHDAWMFKCANFFDADIIADDKPYINYRQHGDNVTTAYKSSFKRYMTALKERVFKKKKAFYEVIKLFYYEYSIEISTEKREFLFSIVNYPNSFFATIKMLKLQKWKGCSNVDRMFWRLLVLFRLY